LKIAICASARGPWPTNNNRGYLLFRCYLQVSHCYPIVVGWVDAARDLVVRIVVIRVGAHTARKPTIGARRDVDFRARLSPARAAVSSLVPNQRADFAHESLRAGGLLLFRIAPHCSAAPDCAAQHDIRVGSPGIFRRISATQRETALQTIVLYNEVLRRSGTRLIDRKSGIRLSVPKCDQTKGLVGRSYWITSSTLPSTDCGTSRLSARAVVMLIAERNLIEFTIGSSAGFSPLRMRPT
jgi:hypothetical protein